MAIAMQTVSNYNLNENECSEKNAIYALYNELSKGIENMKAGEVYTIEEAWEEIDQI